MVEFKVVVSDPKTGRAYNVDASGGAAGAIVGKSIGDELEAGSLGLAGYKILITGASNRTGITAKKEIPGAGRRNSSSQAVSGSIQQWMASAGKDDPRQRDHPGLCADQRPCHDLWREVP